MSSLQRCALLFLLSLLALSKCAFAQTSSTSLRGTVTDPNGNTISGATVTLRNTESGTERSVATDAEGGYQLQQLPAGSYTLSVAALGFANYSATAPGAVNVPAVSGQLRIITP